MEKNVSYLLNKKKEKIFNMDVIINMLAQNKNIVLSNRAIREEIKIVHRSNIMKLFLTLNNLGIIKRIGKGLYILEDHLEKKFGNKKSIDIFEFYKHIKSHLTYNKSKLRRDEYKYLMYIDLITMFHDNYLSKKTSEERIDKILKTRDEMNNFINDLESYLVSKYGNKYVDRTVNAFMSWFLSRFGRNGASSGVFLDSVIHINSTEKSKKKEADKELKDEYSYCNQNSPGM